MTFEEYQFEAAKTMGVHWNNFDIGVSYGALGLAGEAGEVAEHVKKYLNKSKELRPDDLKKELGDVLWYIAAICEKLGFSIHDVAELNIAKLRKRHGEKFSGYGNLDQDEST